MSIYGCSEECCKIQVNLDPVLLDKLEKEELWALYLLGEISNTKLAELFGTDKDTLNNIDTELLDLINKHLEKN